MVWFLKKKKEKKKNVFSRDGLFEFLTLPILYTHGPQLGPITSPIGPSPPLLPRIDIALLQSPIGSNALFSLFSHEGWALPLMRGEETI